MVMNLTLLIKVMPLNCALKMVKMVNCYVCYHNKKLSAWKSYLFLTPSNRKYVSNSGILKK